MTSGILVTIMAAIAIYFDGRFHDGNSKAEVSLRFFDQLVVADGLNNPTGGQRSWS